MLDQCYQHIYCLVSITTYLRESEIGRNMEQLFSAKITTYILWSPIIFLLIFLALINGKVRTIFNIFLTRDVF
jgi:hypothetical protein